MRFDIRIDDHLGRLLSVIQADGFYEAAQEAAGQIFRCPIAVRETGWTGRSGQWTARTSLDDPPDPKNRFWVGLTGA